jgi:hypothetical protein
MLRIRSKLVFLAGFGLGYYFGTGAGEDRRRQLDDMLHKVEENPTVNKLRSTVRRNVDEVASTVSGKVADTVDAAGDRVSDAVDSTGDRVSASVAPDGTTG